MADQGWDINKPIDHLKVSLLPDEIRGVKLATKTVIQREHVSLDSDVGGQHLKGSTRVYMDSDLPTTDPESNNLDTSATSDDGRIAIATGGGVSTGLTNTMKVYIATSAGISTGFKDVRVGYAGTAVRVLMDNAVSVSALRATSAETTISLIKLNANNLPELGSGAAAIVMTSALPTSSGHVANKDYVDTIAVFDPATQTGGNDSTGTVTFPNGLIMKWGRTNRTGDTTTVTFASAFPNACFQITANSGRSSGFNGDFDCCVHTPTAASFKIYHGDSNSGPFHWLAIGR